MKCSELLGGLIQICLSEPRADSVNPSLSPLLTFRKEGHIAEGGQREEKG